MLGWGEERGLPISFTAAALVSATLQKVICLNWKKKTYFHKESDVILVYVSERLLLQHLTYKDQSLLVVRLQAVRGFGQERFTLGHHHWNCFMYSHRRSRFLCTKTDAWRSVSLFLIFKDQKADHRCDPEPAREHADWNLRDPSNGAAGTCLYVCNNEHIRRCLCSSSPRQYSLLQSEFSQILQNYTLTRVP